MEFQTYVCEKCKHYNECFQNSKRECMNPECYWKGALERNGYGLMKSENFPDYESNEESD